MNQSQNSVGGIGWSGNDKETYESGRYTLYIRNRGGLIDEWHLDLLTGDAVDQANNGVECDTILFVAVESELQQFKIVACLLGIPFARRMDTEMGEYCDLDDKETEVGKLIKDNELSLSHHFDGKGWENKFAVQYGIFSISTM